MWLLAAAALLSAGTHGFSADWNFVNSPRTIAQNSTFPAIAYNPVKGHLEIVAFSANRILHTTADNALTMSPPTEVAAAPALSPGEFNSPHLVVDGKGVCHLVFEHNWYSASKKCWYTNNATGSWRTPLLCMDAQSNPELVTRVNYPRIAVIGDTAYVVAFVLNADTGLIVKITNITNDNIAVTQRVRVANNPDIVATGSQELFIAGRKHYQTLNTVPTQLTQGVHKGSSHEMMGVGLGPDGVVHLIGMRGYKTTTMYYTNTTRIAAAQNVIAGEIYIAADAGPELYVWPELRVDKKNRIFIAYRDWNDGKGKVRTMTNGAFSQPVVFADTLLYQMRYNLNAAVAPDEGVYLAWHDNRASYLTLVGAQLGSTGVQSPRRSMPASVAPATRHIALSSTTQPGSANAGPALLLNGSSTNAPSRSGMRLTRPHTR
jgi:hypothetical protein